MAELENKNMSGAEGTGTEGEELNTRDDGGIVGDDGRISFSEEDLEMLIQKVGDKRISQYQKTLEKKQREADRLREMSAEDKRIYELQQRELALEERARELDTLENKSAGISVLADKGLDSSLIDFVLDSDSEVMYDNIKVLEKAFKKSVREEVERRLASKAPRKSDDTQSFSRKDISKMSMADLAALKQENPEIFESLK